MSKRFTKLDGDGIVWYKDNKTGLEWSETASSSMTFDQAHEWCASVGGRMPTINELLALVDYSLFDPCTSLESTSQFYYWSASTYAPDTDAAWSIDFYDGYVLALDKPDGGLSVRAVRGGKG